MACLIALGVFMVWLVLDRRIERRHRRLQQQIDAAYARAAAGQGASAEQIAVETGRPAADVRSWVEA